MPSRPCGITPASGIVQMKEVAPPSLSSDHVPPLNASSQSPVCKVCAGIPDRHIELTVEILPLIKCLVCNVQHSNGLTCPCSEESSYHFQRPLPVLTCKDHFDQSVASPS